MPHPREHQRYYERDLRREREPEGRDDRAEEERWYRSQPYDPWREGWSARIRARSDERSERLYGRPAERWRQTGPYAREPTLREHEHEREGSFPNRGYDWSGRAEHAYDWRTSAEQDEFARHGNPYTDPRRFGGTYRDDEHAEPRWSPTRQQFHRGPWDPPAYQGAYDRERKERQRYGAEAQGAAPPWHDEYTRERRAPPVRGPKGYTRSDDRIREDICDQLAHATDLDTSEVEVSVSQGEVTLQGSVPHRFMKYEIEEICDHTPGVVEIHNQLRVRRAELSGPSPKPAREEEAHEERSRDERVRDELRRHERRPH